MEALNADASPAGEWSKLKIDGDRWVYSWESTEDGKKISWRKCQHFHRHRPDSLRNSAPGSGQYMEDH